MKQFKNKLIYTLYALLLVVCLTSCDTMEAESDYNKRSWEIKKLNMELDYIERLYKIKRNIEYKQRLSKIDSLISKAKPNLYKIKDVDKHIEDIK